MENVIVEKSKKFARRKEAIRAQSKRDFASKMNISLKEASETEY